MALRIIFMGTPEFSVPILRALHVAGHEIVACYSQPPRPAGRRGLELTPSPVHKAAEELGIEVFTPTSLKGEEEQAEFAAHKADVAVVVAYGLLLPQAILDAPKHGCFNGHASLLPRWRGAAPIQRAIMAGDKETGMMVMKMDAGLDTGPIAFTNRIDITPDMTAAKLHDALSQLGADLMVEAMSALENGALILVPQPEDGIVYASKISKEEARIDWAKSAAEVQRQIMGLSPFPGAWTEIDIGGKLARLKILEATLDDSEGQVVPCGDGFLTLTRVQKAGSRAMNASEFFRGTPFTKFN